MRHNYNDRKPEPPYPQPWKARPATTSSLSRTREICVSLPQPSTPSKQNLNTELPSRIVAGPDIDNPDVGFQPLSHVVQKLRTWHIGVENDGNQEPPQLDPKRGMTRVFDRSRAKALPFHLLPEQRDLRVLPATISTLKANFEQQKSTSVIPRHSLNDPDLGFQLLFQEKQKLRAWFLGVEYQHHLLPPVPLQHRVRYEFPTLVSQPAHPPTTYTPRKCPVPPSNQRRTFCFGTIRTCFCDNLARTPRKCT